MRELYEGLIRNREWYVVTWWLGNEPGFQEYNDLNEAQDFYLELTSSKSVSSVTLNKRTQETVAEYRKAEL